ncbi:MAG: hypothetical protein LUQ25_02445 [Methanoregulaceae archaeon]|nr:hypothetical protein [Methanoregulaceae archaeon]
MKFSQKMAVAAVILIIVTAGLSLYAFDVAKTGIRESTRNELRSVAGVMATQIDAGDLKDISAGDEFSAKYIAVVKKLRTMRSMNDRVTNAYIVRVDSHQNITFVVDDLFLDDPAGSARIGEAYDSPDRMEIFGALSLPTASQNPYTDKWGTFMSGYAPVDDSVSGSSGNTTAVLGVDMDASIYRDWVFTAGMYILLAALISMALTVGVLWIVSRKVECFFSPNTESGPGKWEKD